MSEKEALILKWILFDQQNSAPNQMYLLSFERRLLPRFFQAATVSADPSGLLSTRRPLKSLNYITRIIWVMPEYLYTA
jgi:hypothetical protein